MDLVRQFREAGHGGSRWRATTFWSWNDRLDPEDVRRQVREMARGGLGGAFLHARRGLATAYLGPQWMEAVRAAIDEGAHTGVRMWLYDEDCWPSGTCSGRVYTGRDAFRQKYLIFEEVNPAKWEPGESTVAMFVAEKDSRGRYVSFRRLPEPRAIYRRPLRKHEAAVHFACRMGENVDVFCRDATEEFLRQTHEVYRDAFGGEFGRAIPGIFTDEPQYAATGHRLPWSLELPKYFRRACRYELLDRLPELFFPVGRWRKTRFDFFQAVTRLFLLAWTMPVYQWCERHGLALTGHMMAEDSMLAQVQWTGAAMPHYEYMHIPGIDCLGRAPGFAPPGRRAGCAGAMPGGPVLVKQATSVAAQLARPRTLGEMFGCSGWNASLDDLRLLAEWQFALGLNMICTHLSSLTLRGVRKRDFPPSLHYHQPWWPHYCHWNDYMSRLLSVLSEGTEAADVLIIHPMSSAWAEYSPLDHAPVEELDRRLRGLVDFVLGVHAGFHFGDELILERKGRAVRGRLEVGACRYHLVIVPDATNLRRSTVRLLARLKESGGRIVFAGRVPGLVDGEPSDAPAALAKGCLRADPAAPSGRRALRRALAPALEVLDLRGRDAAAVLAHWRRAEGDNIYFFLNTGPRRVKTAIRLPQEGKVVILDPATGGGRQVEPDVRARRAVLAHTFGPRESLLAVQVRETGEILLPPPGAPSRRMVLGGRWNVRRLDPNVLVLDAAAWRTEEGTYSRPMNVLDIQQDLMQRGARGVIFLRLEFDCGLKDLKGRRFDLVLEQPHACEMWFNGMRAPLADGGPYCDGAFRRVDITPYVRPGANVVELKRPWMIEERRRAVLLGREGGWEARTAAPDVELEAIYVIGDFAVTFPRGSRRADRGSRWMLGRPRMVEESPRLGAADLVRAGYPFFVGRMCLQRDVTIRSEPSPDAVLELPPLAAITAGVHVNGTEAGLAWKSPRTVLVGGLLHRGRNRIAVTLTTSLRNMLGPHHHPDGELYFVTPGSFACEKGSAARPPGRRCLPHDYNVVDFGLQGSAVLRY
ncbi:MAG: hypothetical protein FJ288_01800 [Planctomycetes bacterium]|nr:hypothetical protein [Planctomycetota bacterium]